MHFKITDEKNPMQELLSAVTLSLSMIMLEYYPSWPLKITQNWNEAGIVQL